MCAPTNQGAALHGLYSIATAVGPKLIGSDNFASSALIWPISFIGKNRGTKINKSLAPVQAVCMQLCRSSSVKLLVRFLVVSPQLAPQLCQSAQSLQMQLIGPGMTNLWKFEIPSVNLFYVESWAYKSPQTYHSLIPAFFSEFKPKDSYHQDCMDASQWE